MVCNPLLTFFLCCTLSLAFTEATSTDRQEKLYSDHVSKSRNKRSDDPSIQAVQAVVETLSQRVNTLTAQYDALKTSVSTDKSAVDARIDAETAGLNAKLASLNAKQGVMFLENNRVAFRFSAGSGISAYNSYMIGCNNGGAASGGILTPDTHFRSLFLDLWPACLIDTVRVSVHEHGMENAFVEFNGWGSTKTSWFSLDRVVNSSWTDLKTEPHNYFSIAGDADPSRTRRFLIERHYGGCDGDRGWLMVIEGSDPCPWAQGPFPVILYARRSTVGSWSNAADVGRADHLTVTIKLRSDVTINQDYCSL